MNQDWISVKDQKPPLDEDIIVSNGKEWTATSLTSPRPNNKSEPLYMCSVGFDGYEWDYNFEYEDITDWMPGPDLPK